jgi:hypothetical protein
MIRKEPDASGVGVWVTFVAPEFLQAPVASVVGDFNGWDPHAAPFQDDNGERSARVHLPAGAYRFRYLTGDGEWFDDPDSDNWAPNDHGGADGVLEIAAAPLGPDWAPAVEAEPDVAGELSVLAQLPAARLNV